jgi:hypothetical protein
MEHLTLPSVGASFKKWGCCTPILPKALAHSLNFQKIIILNKKFQKQRIVRPCPGVDPWLATSSRSLAVGQRLDRVRLPFVFLIFFMLSFFWATGQLLLIGSSTCPPWPDPA